MRRLVIGMVQRLLRGDEVEIDLVARYVERLLGERSQEPQA